MGEHLLEAQARGQPQEQADVLFVNPYYFWGSDAWDNRGTGFDHKALQNANKSVSAP